MDTVKIATSDYMPRIFWGLVAGLFVYEGFAIKQGTGETISEISWRLAKRPLIPFAMGFLMGHLYWQRQLVYDAKP